MELNSPGSPLIHDIDKWRGIWSGQSSLVGGKLAGLRWKSVNNETVGSLWKSIPQNCCSFLQSDWWLLELSAAPASCQTASCISINGGHRVPTGRQPAGGGIFPI